MPFDVPCESDELQPVQVFDLIQAFDELLAYIERDLATAILQGQREAESYLDVILATLNRSVSSRLTRLNNAVSYVYEALNQIVTSQVANVNVQLATAIQHIAEELQVSPTELMEISGGATTPTPLPPGQGRPIVPPLTVLLSPGEGEAGVSPVVSRVTQEGAPGAPVLTIVVNGAPLTVRSVTGPMVWPQDVNINGDRFAPYFTVYQDVYPLPTDAAGNPRLSVNYDSQSDGATILSIGPIHVKVDLRDKANPDKGPACAINPIPPA